MLCSMLVVTDALGSLPRICSALYGPPSSLRLFRMMANGSVYVYRECFFVYVCVSVLMCVWVTMRQYVFVCEIFFSQIVLLCEIVKEFVSRSSVHHFYFANAACFSLI